MVEGKKILLTGGAGFIGTHLAERLVKDNEITLLDIDLNGPLRYCSWKDDSQVHLIDGDVLDSKLVDEEVSKCDMVIHLASILGVQKVIENARATMQICHQGTLNVLEAARKNKKLQRLVYFSTSEVYGNVLDAEEGVPASVATDNDARASYAASKLLGEHLTWAYHRDFKIPVTIIRPFNIYGPRRTASNAISFFILKAIAAQELTLHGDGSQIRSWCYIEDFCSAVIASLTEEKAIGEDFNIGSPVTTTTIYDLAQRIIRLSESESKLVAMPHVYSDIGVRAPNSSKAREILGYTPNYDLDSGLAPTISWYRDHLDDFTQWL